MQTQTGGYPAGQGQTGGYSVAGHADWDVRAHPPTGYPQGGARQVGYHQESSTAPLPTAPSTTATADRAGAVFSGNLLHIFGGMAAAGLVGDVAWMVAALLAADPGVTWWLYASAILTELMSLVGVILASTLARTRPGPARLLGAVAPLPMCAHTIVSVVHTRVVFGDDYPLRDQLVDLAFMPWAWTGLLVAPVVAVLVLIAGLPRSTLMPIPGCLRRYATFGGRARRADLVWMLVLTNAITVSILGWWAGQAVQEAFSADADNPDLTRYLVSQLIVCGLFQLALALPVLAVQVRRLHDTDRSGLLVLVSAIPLGGLVLLVLLLMPGTAGDNRFGPDPRRPRPAGI